MRLSLFSLLLLTAATPALAVDPQPEEGGRQSEAREAREPRFEPTPRAERQFREGSEAPRERPARVERIERVEQVEQVQRVEPRAEAPDPVRDVARASVASDPRPEQWSRQPRGEGRARPSTDSAANPGWGWRGGNDERRSRTRDLPPTAGSPVYGSAVPSPDDVTRPSREVSTGSVAAGNLRERIAGEGLRRDRIERDSWRREWRQDRRYDWRRHRDRDRSRFHLGIYIDPFGSRYRDWDIGWRLPSRFYSTRYWISDPFYYRLPPVGGPYRWVRYYDDVLLVDLRSGRVLDRIRGFFWSNRDPW